MIKVMSTCLKVSDGFSVKLLDADDNIVSKYSGYVPKWMPGEHYGDYVELEIEIETGKIRNWHKPTQKQLKAMK